MNNEDEIKKLIKQSKSNANEIAELKAVVIKQSKQISNLQAEISGIKKTLDRHEKTINTNASAVKQQTTIIKDISNAVKPRRR